MKLIITAAAAAIAMLAPFAAGAQGITNADFLKADDQYKRSFVNAAVLMAGHVVAQSNSAKGSCLQEWYFSDVDGRLTALYEVMAAYPDHTPTGIIIALAQQECGSLTFTCPDLE